MHHEVQRAAHQRALDDLLAPERPRELLSTEVLEPRPERDVRRRDPLPLESGEALDRPGRAEPLAAQEQLPEEQGSVELRKRQDAHAPTLSACQ